MKISVGFGAYSLISCFLKESSDDTAMMGGRYASILYRYMAIFSVNDRNKIKKGSVPETLVAAWLDKRTISLADNVVVDTKAHGEYFTENFGLSRDT